MIYTANGWPKLTILSTVESEIWKKLEQMHIGYTGQC